MSITLSRISRRTVTVLAVALLALFVPAESRAVAPDRLSQLQFGVDALRDAGTTGVAVRLETLHRVWTVGSGVSDLSTGQPVAPDGYLRIGSTTKTFVAAVLLQLAGEGHLSLDNTVDTWLPGLVRGHGNDGHRVTLRQLLQHTSGLPDYIGDVVPDLSAAGYRANRWTTYTSQQRVALALRHQPSFEPGAGWSTPTPTMFFSAWSSRRSRAIHGSTKSEPGFFVRCGSPTLSRLATGRFCPALMPATTSSSSRVVP
jgi:D-alanyl-D-alanine carboxypeptidase